MTSSVRMTADRKVQGQSIRSRSQGTYEWLRKDEVVVFRLEVNTALEIEADGGKTQRESSVLTIYDGEYMYTYAQSLATLSPNASLCRAFSSRLRSRCSPRWWRRKAINLGVWGRAPRQHSGPVGHMSTLVGWTSMVAEGV